MQAFVHPIESLSVAEQLHYEGERGERGHAGQKPVAGYEVVERRKEHSPGGVHELSAFVGSVSVL